MLVFRFTSFTIVGLLLIAITGCDKSTMSSGSGGTGEQVNSVNFQAPRSFYFADREDGYLNGGNHDPLAGKIDDDDFNDLAIIHSVDGSVEFLFSDGKGFFKKNDNHPELGHSGPFEAHFLLDFDGNGYADWITKLVGSAALSYFKNDGKGNFKFRDSVKFLSGSGDILPVDIDNDGVTDFVYTRPSVDSISIIYGNSSGFGLQKSFFSGDDLGELACADIDGDGERDVIVTNPINHMFSIFKNKGHETFMSPDTLQFLFEQPISIETADVDNNGSSDLVITVVGNESIFLFRNDGIGNFTQEPIYRTYYPIISITARDMDHDNDVDIVFNINANLQGIDNNLKILKNDGSGHFQDTLTFGRGFLLDGMVVEDFDNDHYPDIGILHNMLYASVLKNNANGTFLLPPQIDVHHYQNKIAVRDMNKDGLPDLISFVDAENYITVTKQLSSVFTQPIDYPVNFSPWGMLPSDFNEDSYDDIVTCGRNAPVVLMLNDKSGGLNSIVSNDSADGAVLVSADFDGNGHIDLLAAGRGALYTLLNLGSGHFDTTRTQPLGIIAQFGFVSDFDMDGDVDVALVEGYDNNNPEVRRLFVLKNNGLGVFAGVDTVTVEGEPLGMIGGDFDGDGDDDLFVSNLSSTVQVLVNESGILVPSTNYFIGAPTMSPFAADLDEDKDIDIAMINRESQGITILLNDGTGTFLIGPTFGFARNPLSLSGGDLDNDEDIDLIVGGFDLQGATIFYNLLKP